MKTFVGFYNRCSFKVCLCAFLSLIVLLVLSSSAFALQSGDFTYTVSGGTVTITGYTGSGGDVVIPAAIHFMPVKYIGNGAFYGCSSLTSVTIPKSVTSIGKMAFSGCTGLTNMTIPDRVRSIGDNAFSHCSGLTNISIFSDYIMSIGGGAFEYCTNLTYVEFPNGVTSIGSLAFSYCSGLTKAVFFGNAPSMGADVFLGCSSDFTVCYTNRSTGFTSPTWCPTNDQCYQAERCILVDSPCPCVKIYGENSEQTELLRAYRDNVLSKTPEGQELIKTYYKFSPTVTKLLEQMPLLKNRAKIFIDAMLPGIRKKVEESN
jgi:hypothetical protein